MTHPRHAAPATVAARPSGHAPTAMRRDIQGLRAVAVGAVVLNHLWPHRMSGGFVGVDVFFVISGFLITTHLNKELTQTGRLRIGRFYARRILRLLPAAFLVIVCSAVAVRAFLPYSQWTQNAREFMASALYSENWVLALRSVDYSAQTEAATAAQHYWSLSVEEQFYLAWPLLLLGLTLLARRWTPRAPTRTTLIALAVIATAFLAVSVTTTASSPNEAYFVTQTRVWEFAVGAITALAATTIRIRRPAADVVATTGLAAILVACFAYGPATPFPGYAAALPVLGTAAVILAGTGHTALAHDVVTGLRPVQFVGDVSYSVYLWHWPLVVVLPFALGQPLGTVTKTAIALASVLLAWLTKVFVEDPGRGWPWAKAATWRPFAAMAAGIAVIVTLGLLLTAAADRESEEAAEQTRDRASGECAGPRSLDDPRCSDPYGPAFDAVMGPANEYWTPAPECGEHTDTLRFGDTATTTICDFSGGRPGTPRVWIVGDSHAQQWEGPLLGIAREHGWRVTTSYMGACPAADPSRTGTAPPVDDDPCRGWQRSLGPTLLADRPDLVITSAFNRGAVVDDGTDRPQDVQYIDAYRAMWRPWTDAGIDVVAIADPPLNAAVRDENCVLMNPQDPLLCAVAREAAHPPDPMTEAARDAPGVTLVDLTRYFCDDSTCYAVVGGIPAYFDANHLNRVYAELLAPRIAEDIPPALLSP